MTTNTPSSLANGTVVFYGDKLFYGNKSKTVLRDAYRTTPLYTTAFEFFADNPDATFAHVGYIADGELVRGITQTSHAGVQDNVFLAPYRERLQRQEAEAECDGSLAVAQVKAELEQLAQRLPAIVPHVSSDQTGFLAQDQVTILEVADDVFNKHNSPRKSGLLGARRRAAQLGFNGVISHNPTGTKYGTGWSPCRFEFKS